jgi:hypothetical protein
VPDILYYLDFNGQTAGPFTLDQVKTFYDDGAIRDETIYSSPNSPNWMPVGILKPLFKSIELSQNPRGEILPETMWADRLARSDSLGSGCLVQLIGVGCVILGLFSLPTVIGPFILIPLGLWLLMKGQRSARWYECSACGGRLINRKGKKCPHCASWFRK